VARSAREKVVLGLGVAAVAAIVAAFAIVAGPAIRFRWRLRGLADARYDVQEATAAWLGEEDSRTLRARVRPLVPALERYVAEHAKENAALFASWVLRRMGDGDPAFLLRLRGSPTLWPAAYRAIIGLQAASLLPEDACEATLDRSEEHAGVNLLWGTQDPRYENDFCTLHSREGASDVLEAFGFCEIADLGEHPLEGIEAIAMDDRRLRRSEPCGPGRAYVVVLRRHRTVNAEIAVRVREHVPGVSAKIVWRVLRVEGL
jgi:hypothetical protein